MLQQTQVNRVSAKFEEFLRIFPTVPSLASASLADVLLLWSGLGYNRRAKFLHAAAQKIIIDYCGIFPTTIERLQLLPGVGYNTAAAIATYAFNQKHVFIETNIRTVYIYHFFPNEQKIDDTMLKPVIADSLAALSETDVTYREWYWALMDYGTFLKKSVGNISRQSKHHAAQSAFEGSRRQIRGMVVKLLLQGPITPGDLQKHVDDARLQSVVADLRKEGLITVSKSSISLA